MQEDKPAGTNDNKKVENMPDSDEQTVENCGIDEKRYISDKNQQNLDENSDPENKRDNKESKDKNSSSGEKQQESYNMNAAVLPGDEAVTDIEEITEQVNKLIDEQPLSLQTRQIIKQAFIQTAQDIINGLRLFNFFSNATTISRAIENNKTANNISHVAGYGAFPAIITGALLNILYTYTQKPSQRNPHRPFYRNINFLQNMAKQLGLNFAALASLGELIFSEIKSSADTTIIIDKSLHSYYMATLGLAAILGTISGGLAAYSLQYRTPEKDKKSFRYSPYYLPEAVAKFISSTCTFQSISSKFSSYIIAPIAKSAGKNLEIRSFEHQITVWGISMVAGMVTTLIDELLPAGSRGAAIARNTLRHGLMGLGVLALLTYLGDTLTLAMNDPEKLFDHAWQTAVYLGIQTVMMPILMMAANLVMLGLPTVKENVGKLGFFFSKDNEKEADDNENENIIKIEETVDDKLDDSDEEVSENEGVSSDEKDIENQESINNDNDEEESEEETDADDAQPFLPQPKKKPLTCCGFPLKFFNKCIPGGNNARNSEKNIDNNFLEKSSLDGINPINK